LSIRSGSTSKGAAIGAWLALAAVTLSSIGYVAAYGANLPRADEWRDALVLLEGTPLTWSWLWAPHNVHRAPLSRLIRFELYRATSDFRSALFFSVLAMAAAGAAALTAASRARPGASWSDLLFPVVLAGPGHFMNYLWGFQVAFTLSSMLFILAIALVAGSGAAPGPRRLTGIGIILLLQLFTGANGLALALPLLLWLAWAALRAQPPGRALRLIPLATVAAAAAVVAAYPRGLEVPPSAAPFRRAIPTLLQFVSTALTPAAPWWKARAFLLMALACGATIILVRAARRIPEERWRATGLLACLGSFALLTLVIGAGRRDLGAQAGLQPRYTTLAAPLLCILFFAFTLFGSGRLRRAVPATLLVLALLATAINTAMAMGYGDLRRRQVAALDRDVRRGLPPDAIAARNGTAIYQYSQGVPGYIDRLIARKAWPFEKYRVDPDLAIAPGAQIDLTIHPASLHDVVAEEGAFRATGPAPALLFRLQEARPVAGLRISFTLDGAAGRLMRLEVRWDRAGGGEAEFPWWIRRAAYPVAPGGVGQTLTVWIYDTIDTIRIDPDRAPALLTITGMALLELPEGWMDGTEAPPG
jgi:hypothetical protein